MLESGLGGHCIAFFKDNERLIYLFFDLWIKKSAKRPGSHGTFANSFCFVALRLGVIRAADTLLSTNLRAATRTNQLPISEETTSFTSGFGADNTFFSFH
jgi:hypothetical protein